MARTFRKVVVRELTGDFRSATTIVDAPWEAPGPGQVLMRNRFAGVNGVFDKNLCANRIRYVTVTPGYDMGVEAIGDVFEVGPGVEHLKPGDAIAITKLGSGYREYFVADAAKAVKVREASAEILTLIPTGISAWVGLHRIAEMQRGGEVVAVSAAAGGLGHVLVQLAKLAGNHVIALTRSPRKAEALRTLGVDRVIDTSAENLRDVLAREYPKGIDLAYDTVGGEVFDAFVDHVAHRGRVIISGHTSDFDKLIEDVPQPRMYRKLYWKSATLRGFQMPAYPEHYDEGCRAILDLYYSGQLKVWVDPTPFIGLEAAADAVEHLLGGRNLGKVVVSFP
jgi:NADPH-dependent curcumin reductase CurA